MQAYIGSYDNRKPVKFHGWIPKSIQALNQANANPNLSE